MTTAASVMEMATVVQARTRAASLAVRGLNEMQRAAVEATESRLLILSGAGTGKTRALTHRVAHLISGRGVKPNRILAVTFTNKAAGEMRERVERLLAESGAHQATKPTLATFHSLAARLLRRWAETLGVRGIDRDFSIYDADDSQRAVKELLKEAGIDKEMLAPRFVADRISRAKNRGLFAADFADSPEAACYRSDDIAALYRKYEERLVRANALDFDDLLLRCVQLLRERADVRERLSSHLTDVLVDEFQDTNVLQIELVKLLSTVHGNVWAVGDEDQLVYGWRSAELSHILEFDKHFPGARVIRLEQNYRSTANIISAARSLVARNRRRLGKTLWTRAEAGTPVRVYEAASGDAEADYVADRIADWLREPSEELPVAAILYRTNAQSLAFEEALRRRSITYRIVGAMSFYERREVKDIMAYLKVAANGEDRAAFERAVQSPSRGLGEKTLAKLYARAEATGRGLWETAREEADAARQAGGRKPAPTPCGLTRPAAVKLAEFVRLVEQARALATSGELSRLVGHCIEQSGYGESLRREKTDEAAGRIENLGELISAAAEHDGRAGGLREFIDHAALISSADEEEGDADAPVVMMTIHAAKGLEFPVVFVVGVEEVTFPNARAIADDDGLEDEGRLEEERRLAYVAMTRARRQLTLSWAARRRVFNQTQPREMSRFLGELYESVGAEIIVEGDY